MFSTPLFPLFASVPISSSVSPLCYFFLLSLATRLAYDGPEAAMLSSSLTLLLLPWPCYTQNTYAPSSISCLFCFILFQLPHHVILIFNPSTLFSCSDPSLLSIRKQYLSNTIETNTVRHMQAIHLYSFICLLLFSFFVFNSQSFPLSVMYIS